MSLPSLRSRALLVLALIGIAVLILGLKAMNKTSVAAAVVAADPQVQKIAAANTSFGFGMLHTLDQSQSDGNIFFSPLSISSALTMTLNGAGGQTAQDMTKTLGLEALTRNQVNAANGLLLPSLANPDPKVEVKIANALWARR